MNKAIADILKRLAKALFVSTLLCTCNCPNHQKNSAKNGVLYTDMANRTIAVPNAIKRVVSNGSPGTILLYTLAEDLMVARNNPPTLSEQRFCTKNYCKLPVIGTWFATNGTRNVEELIKIQPDIIVSGGNINQAAIDIVNKDQAHLHIPIIQISTNLFDLTKSYHNLAELLGKQEKANELIAFINQYIPTIIRKTAQIPKKQKKRIYLAIGENGLSTSTQGSLHSQVMKLAGGVNVVNTTKAFGHVNVSMEQLLVWNPDVIITCGTGLVSSDSIKQNLLKNQQCSGITAIKNKQIFAEPTQPFCWMDMPPSVNQVLGLIWLSNILYPEIFDFDIPEITREFYLKFYHYPLSEEECKKLLKRSHY